MDLPGYTVVDTLYAGPRSRVVRATSPEGRAVVIKTPTSSRPTQRELARYQRAWELGREADERAVVPPVHLHRHRSTVALMTADLGGDSLNALIPSKGLRLRELLEVAVGLSTAVARLHGSGIVHRDIKPANAIRTPAGEIRLIDLGSATHVDEPSGDGSAADRMEGTLPYMSPEQCGRIHGAIDERSDLYSLGISLFQFATGKLPFEGEDPKALAHAHVARTPPRVGEHRPDLPDQFADIVDQLLRKNPEERYATAHGLLHDLSRCLDWVRRTGTIQPFPLGQADVSSRFRLPERLYGREAEVGRLTEGLAALARGERVGIEVLGRSGIGKTALVREVRRQLAVQEVEFCAGKFDQYRSELPYLGVMLALRELLRRELASPEDRLNALIEQLREALGANAALLTASLPELADMLGPQPPLDEVGPLDAARRFHRVATQFMGVFAREERPMVLFIDDLQWADAPSLQLLESLASADSLGHLMLVTGYRSEELGEGHPARRTLEVLAGAADRYEVLALDRLSLEDVNHLVADTVQASTAEVHTISRHIHTVADGNPFFVCEFLMALRRAGYFQWSESERRWTWDAEALRRQEVPDSVADLLTTRLEGLPADCVDLLDTASCVGGEFELDTLAQVHQVMQRHAARGLGPAVERGLVVPLDAEHSVFESLAAWSMAPEGSEPPPTARYRFQHDQVRQRVHERLDADRRAERHLQIGRLVLQTMSEEGLSTRLVEVFDHILYGASLVTDQDERIAFARHGLRAGQAAHQALAFDTADRLLRGAIAFLPEGAWEEAYETALGLHLALARCCHARGEYGAFEEVAGAAVARARTAVDAGRVHGLRIRVRLARNQNDEAVDLGVAVARELGVSLPRKPTLAHVGWGVVRALWAQGSRDALEFESLSECEDTKIREAVSLLTETASAAYFAEPNLLPLIGITCTRLAIGRGLTPHSPYGFAVWALVLCGVLGRIENGHAFGELALRVGRRYGGVEEARARFVVDAFVRHWREPLEECARHLRVAWASNRDTGDEETATYAAGVGLYTEFLAGVPLDAPERTPEVVNYLRDSQQPHVKYSFLAWVQLIHCLREPELPETLTGDWYDHAEKLAWFEETNNEVQIALSTLAAAVLDHFAGRLEQAQTQLQRVWDLEEKIVGQVVVPGLATFYALNAYQLILKGGGDTALHWKARWQHRRLRQWAEHSPGNLAHRVALLDGWAARVRGRPAEALLHFHKADALCAGSSFLYQGMAREALVGVLEGLGNEASAMEMRERARRSWLAWGSRALADAVRPVQAVDITGSISSADLELANLDLETMLGAITTISSEIDSQRLIDRLVRTAMEATGGDRVVLLLRRGDRVVVEVALRNGEEPERLDCFLDDYEDVARPALALARRQRGPVVVQDTRADPIVAEEPYVLKSGVRALLVVPIGLRGTTIGWMYFENRLTRGAFTADRVTLATALGGQAGVALDNATLYGRVQQALAEQTALTEANRRFVPEEFLEGLGCTSIVDVKLNEVRERVMNVLFVDLRGFSKLSLELGPRRTIEMINRYLSYVQPAISENNGFVGQYYGDGLLAVFPDSADDALAAAVGMCRGLERYNAERESWPELRFGLGLHTGPLTLGTIGDPAHFQCGVIGDSVNLASRMEGLTKHFGSILVLSGATRERLSASNVERLRPLGTVEVAGRPEPVDVYECLDCYSAGPRDAAFAIRDAHLRGLRAWGQGDWGSAIATFEQLAKDNPNDRVSAGFFSRAQAYRDGASDWDGVERPAKGS